MNSSTKMKRIFLLSCVAVLAIFLAITLTDESKGTSEDINMKDLATSQPTPSYEEYAYYTYSPYWKEYKVIEVDALNGDDTGFGVFHIRGEECGWAPWPLPPVTSTTRASIYFNYDNIHYAERGLPVSYEVRATISYRNYNDDDGYVKLYVQDDDGGWQEIWGRSGLSTYTYLEYDVLWASSNPDYYRNDGSMRFRLRGQTVVINKLLNKPSCRVKIESLRVKVNYGPHAYYTYSSDWKEYKVEEVDALGGDSSGAGVFHIRGLPCGFPATSTTRASIYFGFVNPYYHPIVEPAEYTVKCIIRYRNWNDINGYVRLYVQRDNGGWHEIPMSGNTGLNHVDKYWEVSWTSSSNDYYRDNGDMRFRLRGESVVDFLGYKPSCKVNIWNLRVDFRYGPHADAGGPYEVDEGSPVNFDASASFHLYDKPLSYRWDIDNDGTYDTAWSSSPYASYIWYDDYIGTAKLQVKDSDGLKDTDTIDVIVNNVRPTLGYVSPVYEANTPVTISVPIIDPGILDTWTATLDWNDGSPVETFSFPASDPPPSIVSTHLFLDDDPTGTPYDVYPITITVEDDDCVVYTQYYSFSPEVNVVSYEVSTNIGEGSFTIFGDLFFPLVTPDYTRASLYFNLQNPYYAEDGAPASYEVEWGIGYFNDNDFDGWIKLYVLRDDGTWGLLWGASNLGGSNVYTWADSWKASSGLYYRNDGSMSFRLIAQSQTNILLDAPACIAAIANFRAHFNYPEVKPLIVCNVPPYVSLGPDRIVNEGTTVNFDGSFSDPGILDTHTIEWDFGSGFIEMDTLHTSYHYPEDGIYFVTLRVTDDDQGVGTDTVTVTVRNVAPTATAWPDHQTIDEGDPAYFTGFATDPGGIYDPISYSWDFGDGSTGIGMNPSHIYKDNGVYTVTLFAEDDDGGVGTAQVTVTVNNVDPTAIAEPDHQTINEGDTAFFSGTCTDPGVLDTHTYHWDFGDGKTGTGMNPSNEYEDNGIYTVTLTVTDDDGGVGTTQVTVTVLNVAPTVNAGPDRTVNEGQPITFSGSFSDPGADTYRYYWDFGEGAGYVLSTTLIPTHVYQVPGVYTVSLKIVDDDGGVGTDSLMVTVKDITDPISTLTILPPFQGTEEPYLISTITELVITADDGDGLGVDVIKYRIDDGAWVTHVGNSVTFTIPDAGFHTIEYYSIDKAGNDEGIKSLDVIVNTCKLTYIGETSGFYSDPVQLQATLFDVATGDPISGRTVIFTIDYQIVSAITDSSGVASIELILDQPGGLYTVTAVFEGDGVYLADSDSASFTIEKEYVVLSYTGSTVIPTTVDTITLRVTVYDDADLYWGDLNKIYVTFYIYDCPMPDPLVPKKSSGPHMVEFTMVDGVGYVEIEVPHGLTEGGYLIQVVLSPGMNDYYQGDPSDLVILTIYEPTGDFVTGGGWIWDSDGNKGNFGFNVKYKKNGLPKGQAIYVFREGDWQYIVKSNAWQGMAIIGNHSFFEAKCVVQKYNSKTGEFVWSEGNYQMRVDVWDEYNDEGDDVYQIRVYDKIGQVYHEAGFDPFGFLQGGNIVIHTENEK
jgi:PKD repeat protein